MLFENSHHWYRIIRSIGVVISLGPFIFFELFSHRLINLQRWCVKDHFHNNTFKKKNNKKIEEKENGK